MKDGVNVAGSMTGRFIYRQQQESWRSVGRAGNNETMALGNNFLVKRLSQLGLRLACSNGTDSPTVALVRFLRVPF